MFIKLTDVFDAPVYINAGRIDSIEPGITDNKVCVNGRVVRVREGLSTIIERIEDAKGLQFMEGSAING